LANTDPKAEDSEKLRKLEAKAKKYKRKYKRLKEQMKQLKAELAALKEAALNAQPTPKTTEPPKAPLPQINNTPQPLSHSANFFMRPPAATLLPPLQNPSTHSLAAKNPTPLEQPPAIISPEAIAALQTGLVQMNAITAGLNTARQTIADAYKDIESLLNLIIEMIPKRDKTSKKLSINKIRFQNIKGHLFNITQHCQKILNTTFPPSSSEQNMPAQKSERVIVEQLHNDALTIQTAIEKDFLPIFPEPSNDVSKKQEFFKKLLTFCVQYKSTCEWNKNPINGKANTPDPRPTGQYKPATSKTPEGNNLQKHTFSKM
jgi:hypothetical protein